MGERVEKDPKIRYLGSGYAVVVQGCIRESLWVRNSLRLGSLSRNPNAYKKDP